MINIKEQQDLLNNIAKELKKELVVYAVGGTAMMFHGIKDTTKDIDLVFDDEKSRKHFKDSAISLGYKEFDSVIVYGAEKENQPIMLTRGKGEAERFDLFNHNVISFFFSETMKKRAENIVEFGGKLVLKIADVHDLILMKCATDRQKDVEDVKTIVETQKIDWGIVISEAKHQVILGKHLAFLELGDFLDKLKNELKVNIPKEVLDELYNLLIKEIEKKKNSHQN